MWSIIHVIIFGRNSSASGSGGGGGGLPEGSFYQIIIG